MAKLNQIIAVEQGVRQRNYSRVTHLDKEMAKEPLVSGLARSYVPKLDDGDQLPPEGKEVQVVVADALGEIKRLYEHSMDVTATKEWSNTVAMADIVLEDGTVLIEHAPVPYMLFLEKQLTDIQTLVGRLPVLDPAKRWHWDTNANAYAAEPKETIKTTKVPQRFVKYDATKEHPAQVEMYFEDEPVGTWTTIEFSGALPAEDRAGMLDRVTSLIDAVKRAREAANDLDVTDKAVASRLLQHIFQGAA